MTTMFFSKFMLISQPQRGKTNEYILKLSNNVQLIGYINASNIVTVEGGNI